MAEVRDGDRERELGGVYLRVVAEPWERGGRGEGGGGGGEGWDGVGWEVARSAGFQAGGCFRRVVRAASRLNAVRLAGGERAQHRLR